MAIEKFKINYKGQK